MEMGFGEWIIHYGFWYAGFAYFVTAILATILNWLIALNSY